MQNFKIDSGRPHTGLSLDKMHLNIILNRQVKFPFSGKFLKYKSEIQL